MWFYSYAYQPHYKVHLASRLDCNGDLFEVLVAFLWSLIYFNLWPQASTECFHLHSCCSLVFSFWDLFSANPWDGCHVVIIPVDQQFVKSVTIWRHIVNEFVLWVKMCSTVGLWCCHVHTEAPMGWRVLYPVNTWIHRRFYLFAVH